MEVEIFMAAYVNKEMKNRILEIHAEWLLNNEYFKQSKECFKEAKQYSKTNDKRQTTANTATT